MLPGIDLRLQNLTKALQDVILPSIPTRERLARDQVMLVIAHLKVIAIQWQSVAAFEAGSLDELCGLVKQLVEYADATVSDELLVEARNALKHSETIDRQNHDAVKSALLEVGRVSDMIIGGQAPLKPLNSSMANAVLDYGARQSLRERAWFSAHNLDPDKAELPSLENVLSGTVRTGIG